MSLDVYLECPCCKTTLFTSNITHNLNKMATEAGLYKACWRPEEIGATTASQISPLLSEGLARLRNTPEKFRAMNPENGWGDYEGLVRFVGEYMNACIIHPDAKVTVSR